LGDKAGELLPDDLEGWGIPRSIAEVWGQKQELEWIYKQQCLVG